MRRHAPLSAILALSSALAACNTLPQAAQLPVDETRAKSFDTIEKKGPQAISVVPVPAAAMTTKHARDPLPDTLASTPVEVRFPAGPGTLADLVTALDAKKIQIVFRWDTPDNEALLERRLPFTRYSGDFGGLMKTLRQGLGIAYWWENGSVFVSDTDRFAVTLPQNKDVLEAVSSELKSLGAKDVLTSIRGGTIVFSASPRVHDEIISPYLHRLLHNLSMVTLQVAIVSVAMTDQTAAGFDWSAFAAKLDTRKSTISNLGKNLTNDSSTTGTGTTGTGGTTDGSAESDVIREVGTVVDMTSKVLSLGQTVKGTVFGVTGALSVTGAISFLSEFGTTKVSQNVELRTLSGSEVKLRSGQEIPYVSGVGVSTTGTSGTTTSGTNSGLLGSTQTSKVETGLTVKMLPNFDWVTSTVTVDVDLELKSVLEFVQLEAGNQIGTLSQPVTQDQSLTDIVRMAAGQTIVIGGLQYDSEDYKGNDPTFLRPDGSTSSKFGKNSQEIKRNALFIILRPAVTVFAPSDDLEVPVSKFSLVPAPVGGEAAR